jgi:flagellar hook protein FlgE
MAFTALAAGVSGLQAFTEGVGVIADNITNVNTIGYKETRSRFSTLVTETSARASYSPGGVRAFADSLISKQGLLQPSSSPTDLAVDGAGFFVVRKSESALSTEGEINYTRAGAFSQDADGFFKNTAGLFLLGWRLDSAGVPPANRQDENVLEPINITQLNGISEATTTIAARVNLQASTTAQSYTDGDLSAGNITADFETNVQIFDSLGREHTVVVAAAKTSANTWNYEYYFDDPTALDTTEQGSNGLVARGTLVFNSDGSFDQANSTLVSTRATGGGSITLPTSASNPLTFAYSSTGSLVDDGSLSIDFGADGDTDGWTQFESASSLISSSVNGARFDNVNGISIDNEGIVSALFDNGLSLKVYQLPVALFDNPNGLQRRQGNSYGGSDNSGKVTYQEAGTSGAGGVAPNALEQSTVDLANEFSELIKVQRAFSASTRIITTADQILEELVRI